MNRHLCIALGLGLILGSFLPAVGPPSSGRQDTLYSGRPLRAWLGDLDDSDLLVREEAACVLAQVGPAARAALPQLRKLLTHDNRSLRTRAALALWKVSGDTKP